MLSYCLKQLRTIFKRQKYLFGLGNSGCHWMAAEGENHIVKQSASWIGDGVMGPTVALTPICRLFDLQMLVGGLISSLTKKSERYIRLNQRVTPKRCTMCIVELTLELGPEDISKTSSHIMIHSIHRMQ